MMRINLCLAQIMALLVIAGQVSGATIFDNGVPDLSIATLSDFKDGRQVADDFQLLPGASTVTGVHWWGAYFNGNTPTQPDDFTIRFFADDSGVPAVNPLAEIAAGDVGRTATGQTVGSDVYEYTAAFAPVALNPNTTYWLSIVNDTTADRDDLWFWPVKQSIGNGATRNSDADAWTGSGRFVEPELAFSLTGPPVPEPASLALAAVLLGLVVGLALRLHWRK